METKNIKLLIVTNSLPLPVTDFLRYKVIGLNNLFDMHLMCWDTPQHRSEFLQKYPAFSGSQLHVQYKPSGIANLLSILISSLAIFFAHPAASLVLWRKVGQKHTSLKKRLDQYLMYLPMVKIKPDIVHFEFGTLAHSFRDIKDYFQCKVSTSFRGYDLNYVGLDDKNYYTKVWDTFDGFHFLGNDLKQRGIRRGYQQHGVEALIAPAVDTTLFEPVAATNQPGKFIIVSTCRIVWKKGLEYGLRAVAILKQRGIPVSYRIIGDGDYMQAVQFTIFELGLQDDVVLLGKKNKEEIKKELANANVFLHPAVSEGFCNAVVEAQAMGVPVVTTDADGLSENVANGETGFVVPKWDVEAMAEKLNWCYMHSEETRAMGQKGILRVAEHFRLETQIAKFRTFYQQLYANGKQAN